MTVWIYAKTTARAAAVAGMLGLAREDFLAFGNQSNARGFAAKPGDRVIVLHGASEGLETDARIIACATEIQIEYWAERADVDRAAGEPA